VLVVGTQLDYFFGYGRFPHLRGLVQVDIDPHEIGRNRAPVTVGIVADARATLEAIAAHVPQLATDNWVASLQASAAERTAARDALAKRDGTPIHPLRVCAEVAARLAPDDTLVGDASNMLMW